MADVDVSESTHSTIAGDENEQPRLLMSQGNCVYSKSFGKNVGHLPSVPEESGVYSSESTDSAIYQNDMMGSDHGEVQKLNEIASGYALRGDEQTAIDIYKRALVFAAGEVDMIKSRIENTSREPEYLKDAIYQMLFREWTDMSLSIAETKTMMAVLYERMGDYDCAIEVCNEAKDVYERQLLCDSNDQSELYASVEEKFSLINHMNEKLSGARETYQARRHLHETAVRIHSELKSIMDCDQRRVLFDAMLNKLSEALQLEMESLGQYHPQVAETLAFISKIQLEKNDATEALRSIEQAVKTAEIALGTKHPNTGEKYYELARQFERLNREKCDRTNAITFYEKALETLGEAEGDHSRILGAISNDMGVLLLQEGRHDEALEKLTDALEVYDSIEAPHSDAMYADTAQILRNLAKCYVRRKEWDQAAVNFSAALDAQHQARKQFEAKVVANPTMEMPLPIHDETIADTMKRLGKVYTAMHQYEKADKILLDALTIFQNACEYFKANSKKVTRLELAAKQDQLANIVFCLAKVKEATHNFDEAIRLYDEALELRIYSDKVRKKTEKVNHVHIAMCLAGIGKMRMAKGDCVIAFKAFNEAIQNARKEGEQQICVCVYSLLFHSLLTRIALFSQRTARISSNCADVVGAFTYSGKRNAGSETYSRWKKRRNGAEPIT